MDSTDAQLIEQLRRKVDFKEEELARLKEAINTLSVDAGLNKPYPDVRPDDAGGDLSSIRADIFYGQPMSTAIRTYLDMRKSSGLGAASLNDIYQAVKAGGFRFAAKDEENEKASVRLTLRKNSGVFHKLPNGQYGLLAWYPGAKEQKQADENGDSPRKKLVRVILKTAKAKKISKGKKEPHEEESKSAT